jgi:hypothetical protein
MVCSILARAGWSFNGRGTSCGDETVSLHAPPSPMLRSFAGYTAKDATIADKT